MDNHVIEERAKIFSFEDLCGIEPGLEQLFLDCQKYKPVKGKTCPLHDWYMDYKPRLIHLVGFGAENENIFIRTSRAYNLAYQKCFDALRCPPGCQCGGDWND